MIKDSDFTITVDFFSDGTMAYIFVSLGQNTYRRTMRFYEGPFKRWRLNRLIRSVKKCLVNLAKQSVKTV